jgi:hypothetical protein
MAAHDKSVAFALRQGPGRAPSRPASGDTNHVVYLEAHSSFAEMEAKDRKVKGHGLKPGLGGRDGAAHQQRGLH